MDDYTADASEMDEKVAATLEKERMMRGLGQGLALALTRLPSPSPNNVCNPNPDSNPNPHINYDNWANPNPHPNLCALDGHETSHAALRLPFRRP